MEQQYMNNSVSNIKKICVKEETYNSSIIRLTRKITPYLTWIILKFGLSANQTTILGMVVGTIGAVLLSFNSVACLLSGIFLLHFSNLLDYCDGEIARFHNHYSIEKKGDSSGAYLDWLWHFYIPTTTIFFLSLGVYKETETISILVIGFVVILGFCIFPFSCKEHILIDQIRKNPDMIYVEAFKIAMLDKPQTYLQSNNNTKPTLYKIKKMISECVYYPSFFNGLTFVIVFDIIINDIKIRFIYLLIMCILIIIHQVSAIRKNYLCLKSIKHETY